MSGTMDPAREIETLVRAKYPLLFVVSWEERRVEDVLRKVADARGRSLHVWTLTQGFQPDAPKSAKPTSGSSLPPELEALARLYETDPEAKSIVLLKDFHPFLKDHRVIRLLRDLSARLRTRNQTLVLLSPSLTLPSELEKDASVVDFPLPGEGEIAATLDRIVNAMRGRDGIDVSLTDEARETLVKSAQGLTRDEIEAVFARSLVEHRRFDVDVVLEEKKQIIRKGGTLEYYAPEAALQGVGGLELLKEWLSKRTASFTDKAREFGLPAPKGILLLGVQGCGKSLTAKAVAAQWNLPLLKMDVGRLFGSYVGQSEENLRRAIAVAESVAPCVLWVDELEKGFAGTGGAGANDSGTTARFFATFLTWMSEKTSPVFLIATANDVTSLPPELLRKGRFDEIFFVDLPDRAEREEIFRIHLKKRKRDPAAFDLPNLAVATDGFSGAEIEQVVVGGLFLAFDAGRELETGDLLAEAEAVVPLSEMMSEEIGELRDWAAMRTRPASRRDD